MNKRIRGIAFLAAAVGIAGAAHAATFAQYEAVSAGGIPTQNIQWVGGPGGGVLSDVGPSFLSTSNVQFSFLEGDAAGFVQNVPALFTMSLSSSAAPSVSGAGVIEQDGLSGAFSFVYEGASPISFDGHTYNTGATLLKGLVSGAYLSGHQSAPGAGVFDADAYGVVTFSSDFVSIDNSASPRAFSIEMTGVTPLLSVQGGYLNSFGATSTGTFQASLSSGGSTGGVPEPGAWSLMILGVGLAGATLRRRRSLAFAQV